MRRDRRAVISKKRRQQIFARDKNRCAGCRRSFPPSELTIDHVVPLSRGGSAQKTKNLQAMCQPCNVAKGNRLPGEPLPIPEGVPYGPFETGASAQARAVRALRRSEFG